MSITRIKLENFTAFEDFDLSPSSGVNVFVGPNGVGKTHLLKVCYAACDVSKTGEFFDDKLVKVFLPTGPSSARLGRLINRGSTSGVATVKIFRGGSRLELEVPINSTHSPYPFTTDTTEWADSPVESVYIPAKDMLANAPGFRSLYAAREIHFEEVYADLLDRAYLPPLRGRLDSCREGILAALEKAIGGKVAIRGEEFFLSNEQGELEFTLLAEGLRKLALLWLLIRNGTLADGSILFWDEPEANLNPILQGLAVETLLELQRMGVQVFMATHEDVILNEFSLRQKEGDAIAFHSLYRPENGGAISCNTTGIYWEIRPNPIGEAHDSLYDREIARALGGLK